MKHLVLAALLLGAAPTLAQTPPTTPTGSPTADDDRIICERIKETGSRLASKKICMTKLQWEEKRRNDRQELEDAQNRRTEPSGS